MAMTTRLGLAAGIALAAALAFPSPALAQHQGDGFLFRQPWGSFAFRMGVSRPNASGDPYADFTDQLTLSKASFAAVSLAGDLAVTVGDRADLVFSLGWDGSNAPSEMRHWLDPNDQPIRQTTALQRVPLSASLKYYVIPRGRSVGQFAWVPLGYSPYVGAGVGLMYYRLHQWGNFVNYADSMIFEADIQSSGWTGMAHAFAGVDVPLGPRFVLSGEARYTWAKASLGSDFEGFDRIDLSGFSVTAGVAVRF